MAWTDFPSGNDPCASPTRAVNGGETINVADASRTLPAACRSTKSADAYSIQRFRQVLLGAEQTFDRAASGDRTACLLAPMLHTVACHNLAAALISVGDLDEARDLYLRMVSKLVHYSSRSTCLLLLRVNCVRHMRPAIHLLLTAAGKDPQLVADMLIAQAQRAAHEVIHVASQALEPGTGRSPSIDAPLAALH